MGSSISKVFKRKDRKFEPNELSSPLDEIVETHRAPPPRQPFHEESTDEEEEIQPPVYQDTVHRNEVYGNNSSNYDADEYYDDEDMIQFVSALSLDEFNQKQPSSSSSKPEPKHPHRLPDALEEFFISLDAYATAGQSSQSMSPSLQEVKASHGIEEDSPSKKECAICVEEKPLQDFPNITDACQHPDDMCLLCVQNWLAREVDSTDWDKIHCAACKEIVPYDDMKRLMTKAAFEKYDQYARNAMLSNMPNFRWCISPKCKSGQIHEDGTDGPIFFCGACYSKACVIHNVPWHEGETCAEYSYRQDPTAKAAEERASAVEIKGSSKKCPGPRCKVNITRNGGCDHMKCTRCNYEFCWLCLADYNKIRKHGNSSHEESCKLHTDNLPG